MILTVGLSVKDDNILICGNTLKIFDFGLSKIAAPLYMAPEAWDFSKNQNCSKYKEKWYVYL